LLGGGPIYMGMRDGGRVTAGAWLDPLETFGVEVGGFALYPFGASGTFTDAGSLRLGMPFFDASGAVPAVHALSAPSFHSPSRTFSDPETEATFTIPGVFILGNAAVVGFNTRSELVGFDANGMYGAGFVGPIRFDLLGGFRYLRLKEDLL